MGKMTVVAFQLEGDEAAISAGCEMIVRAIRQITGVAVDGASLASHSLASHNGGPVIPNGERNQREAISSSAHRRESLRVDPSASPRDDKQKASVKHGKAGGIGG